MMVCLTLSSAVQGNKSMPTLLTSYAFDCWTTQKCNDLSQVSRENELLTGTYDVNGARWAMI